MSLAFGYLELIRDLKFGMQRHAIHAKRKMVMIRLFRHRHQLGFSLIEVIITLVVLSIAAVGVLSVFTTGMTGSADPLFQNQATHLVQEKMDRIIGDRMNPARGYAYINPANYPAETPVAGFPAFNRSVAVFCVTAADLNTSTGAPPCGSGYTHVTVTVTNSVIGNVTAETVVANY